MSDSFVNAFVEKLLLLERIRGGGEVPQLLESGSALGTLFPDTISVQSTAKQLAESIGLSDYTFIVAISKQKINTGAHIDLSTRGKEVFIEIDKDMMRFPRALLATLCHELCHKWLQVHGAPSAHLEIETEILTDITAIYLGFGKILLNGCTVVRRWTENIELFTGNAREYSETINVGYLKIDQLAFVYRLVCTMRNISEDFQLRGLNKIAIRALETCDRSYGQYYSNATAPDLSNQFLRTQHRLADLNKYAIYARTSFCNTSEDFFKTGHQKIATLAQKAADIAVVGPDVTPALQFLRTIQNRQVMSQLNSDLQSIQADLNLLLLTAQQVGSALYQNRAQFPTPGSDIFALVHCPKDGTKLRVPNGGKLVMVRCPVCKCQFGYNSSPLTFEDENRTTKTSWRERLSRIFSPDISKGK